MTYKEIREKRKNIIKGAEAQYKVELAEYRKSLHLNGDVIRKSDGVKGRIQIYSNSFGTAACYHFIPYKKNGELGKKESGFIWDWEDEPLNGFEPCGD